MPIYEYQCTNCNHNFEFMQKMSEDPLNICPECHQHSLNKLVSASGFQLKGSGWYVTDFKDKKSSAVDSKTAESSKVSNKDSKSDVSSETPGSKKSDKE